MRRQRRRRDAAWNPPPSGGDVTGLFAALAAGPLLVPVVVRHSYVLFVLPLVALVAAAPRCWSAARKRPRDVIAWRLLAIGCSFCAVACALAAATSVDTALGTPAFYLGSSGSLGLLTSAALFLRRWAAGAELARLIDALLFDAVVLAAGIYFVAIPGFSQGDAVLTSVFIVDLLALSMVAVAAIAAPDRADRTSGWLLAAACAAAASGDGLVAEASTRGGASSPAVTALAWAVAAGAILLAATDWRAESPAQPAAGGGGRWLGLRVALPLVAVLFYPALTLVLSLEGGLSTWRTAYFAGFFALTLMLAFGRQAYLLADNRRAVARERRLRTEVVRRNEELEALTALATTMTERLDEEPIIERGLAALRIAARARSVALHAPDGDTMRLRASVGDWACEAPWALRRAPAEWTPGTEVKGERLIARFALAAHDHEFGMVTIMRPAVDELTPDELDLLRLLVGQLAVALHHARDYHERLEQAIRDPLTGLYNRRYFYEALDRERHRSGRSNTPLSLVLVDLDDFKSVNDTLGHAAGDRVLAELAGIGTELVRPADTLARLGGEEFALLLPETSQLDALAVAERLRRAVASRSILADRRITVSAGVATWPDDSVTLEGIEAKADAALYWAKQNGKNSCAVASEVVVSPTDGKGSGTVPHLHALVAAIDAENSNTRDHSYNVATYAVAIGERLGLSSERLPQLRRAALFHDIGKIAVPAGILGKQGPLSEAEFAEVRVHPVVGASILNYSGLVVEAGWVRQHHERLDGKGYPDGISRDRVALEARIIFVADAFEAMTSDRPYRAGMGVPEALEELHRCAGSQFDPRVVEALTAIVADGSLPLFALSNERESFG